MGEVFTLTPEDLAGEGTEVATVVDGKRECPDCHRRITVNADGSLRSHKCGDTRTRSATAGKGVGKRGKLPKSKQVPANVQRVGTAAIASGAEFIAARLVASYVPCRPDQVAEAAKIDDPQSMVGPLLTAAWPATPAVVQRAVSAICDQEDLIVCALDWWAWGVKLKAFAEQAHELVAKQQAEEAKTRPAAPVVNITKGHTNGIPRQAPVNGTGPFRGAEPFRPVPASDTAI